MRAGDPDAFEDLVIRNTPRLLSVTRRILKNDDEAREAVQQAFVAAYKSREQFHGESQPSTWLHRIAVNQCLTMKRRQKTRAEDYFDDDDGKEERIFVASPLRSPARVTEQAERMTLVRQAVGALPADLRQVVVMKEFEEMTFQEISETLELPLSTVKSRLYTALKQLKMRLERTPVEVV